jgi:hypothetical protein
MALAVLTVGFLVLWIPEDFRVFPAAHVLFPLFLLALMALLVWGDPGRIDRETPWLRAVTGVMIGVITLVSAGSAARLVVGLLAGADFSAAGELLTIGVIVWTSNVIAFALWFWHLDAGGPAARAARWTKTRGAFAFPEEDLPALLQDGWYPQFVDYLALSFNTSTAFGPTDVSAVRHWSKLWMMAEASVSLTILLLVVARAVNVL